MAQWFEAAAYDDIQTVFSLLLTCKKQQDEYGRTALMVSALHSASNALGALKNEEYRCQTPTGETALMFAACVGNLDGVDALCDLELKEVNERGYTALMFAAYGGHAKCVKALLKEASMTTFTGEPALFIASARDNVDCVRYLLKREKLIQPRRKTALMVAASNGATKCVKYLKSHFLNQVDAEGKTALIYALEAGNRECAEMLLDESSCAKCKHSPLIVAVRSQLYCMLDKFEEHVNRADEDGNTALMLICRAKQYQYIDELIEEAGCQDNDGVCASMILAVQGALEELKKLYVYENMLSDVHGATIMHYACISGNIELIRFLYPTFAFARDENGVPPVYWAIQHDFLPIAQYFEQYEGQRNDNNLRTELMVAATADAFECCQYFLATESGQRSADKLCALDYCCQSDSVHVFPMLYEAEQSAHAVILQAAIFDSYRILRLIREVATTGSSSLVDYQFQQRELQSLTWQISAQTFHYEDFPDEMNPLVLSIQCGSSSAVRVLAPIYSSARFQGYTALMYAIIIESPLTVQAWNVLVAKCSGQTLEAQDEFPAGTTALMLASMKNTDNIELIKLLLPVEKDMVNQEGHSASYFAEIADRDDIIQLLA